MLLNSVWVGFVLMVTWVLVVCMHGGRHNRGRTTWAFIRLRRQRKKTGQPFNKMRKKSRSGDEPATKEDKFSLLLSPDDPEKSSAGQKVGRDRKAAAEKADVRCP